MGKLLLQNMAKILLNLATLCLFCTVSQIESLGTYQGTKFICKWEGKLNFTSFTLREDTDQAVFDGNKSKYLRT